MSLYKSTASYWKFCTSNFLGSTTDTAVCTTSCLDFVFGITLRSEKFMEFYDYTKVQTKELR